MRDASVIVLRDQVEKGGGHFARRRFAQKVRVTAQLHHGELFTNVDDGLLDHVCRKPSACVRDDRSALDNQTRQRGRGRQEPLTTRHTLVAGVCGRGSSSLLGRRSGSSFLGSHVV